MARSSVALPDRVVADVLRAGRRDPVAWMRHYLDLDPWHVQAEIVRDVFRYPRVAVKACHASGKTHIAAATVIAFHYLYPRSKVITTAPTWEGVEKLLWGEIGSLYQRLPKEEMGGELLATELRSARDWWAMGLSTNEGVRFQGHHAWKMLVVIDEAPGVKPDIWTAIDSLRAGGDVHVLALGNPDVPSGPFYDAFTSPTWKTHTINAFSTPNLAGLTLEQLLAMPEDQLDDQPRPYLITRRWVREKWYEWGADSPLWSSKVLGEFPQQATDALIWLAWLGAARRRPAVDPGGPVRVGIDVAGPGEDETVVVVQAQGNILALHAWSKPDPRGDVLAVLEPWRERIERVSVDSAGLGYYFGLFLRDQPWLKGKVRLINVGEQAHQKARYLNLRAELYWALRQHFQDGDVHGLTDELLYSQLASIRYEHNARGQVVIESKEEARKRGVRSPDRAEALMLALADPTRPGLLEYYRQRVEAANEPQA